jgi:SAM-dependent methyltransferase
MTSAAQRWREDLEAWAIPPHIMEKAPESPWVHPPALFRVDPDTEFTTTPSVRAALAALGGGGTVLDVGCGGGGSSMALAASTTHFTGVDEQAAMLTNYAEAARHLGVPVSTVEGTWATVAANVPAADVVVCHHVVYNVGHLDPFLRALTNHARRRVVVELPATHPTSPFNPLWKHFWNIDRPTGPTADDFVDVVKALGCLPSTASFRRPPRKAQLDSAEYVAFVRRRLCLDSSHDAEIASVLASMDSLSNDETVTVWWPGTAREIGTDEENGTTRENGTDGFPLCHNGCCR